MGINALREYPIDPRADGDRVLVLSEFAGAADLGRGILSRQDFTCGNHVGRAAAHGQRIECRRWASFGSCWGTITRCFAMAC